MIAAQGAVVAAAFAVMAFWPPSSGRMLLVPVAGGDANVVAKVALAAGAGLLGSGPLPGSMLVVGDRARILRAITGSNIVVVAAPRGGCSPTGTVIA